MTLDKKSTDKHAPDSPQGSGSDTAFGDMPLRQYLTLRISRVQAKLNAQATRMLRETSGITLTQWRVIALVGSAGETRLSTIARETALDKGLLSRSLKTLMADGVVLGTTDEHDHRVQILTLTDKGQAIFAKTLPVTRARQTRLRAGLSEEELRVFREVLDKIEAAAEE